MGINVLIMLHPKGRFDLMFLLLKKQNWCFLFGHFSSAICEPENQRQYPPVLCTAPIKVGMQPVQFILTSWRPIVSNPEWFHPHIFISVQFANFKNDDYNKTGKGSLKLQLINQREDFSFALFSGGLLAVSGKHCILWNSNSSMILKVHSFMFSIWKRKYTPVTA